MPISRSPSRETRSSKNTEQNTENEEDTIENESRLQLEWARLKEEQRKLEELRAEIEAARATIPPAGNTRGKTARKGQTKDQGDTEERLVNGVINHLQYIHLDVKPPKFSDENKNNPNEFLTDLEKYFHFKNVRDEHKIIVTESLLEGRAKIWMNSGTQTFRSYREFREAFLNEFYSIPIRVKLKNQWLSRRYRNADGNLQEYFYTQMRTAKYFEPELSVYEIIFSILQQFPNRIRESLASVEYNIDSVSQALSRLDGVQRERDFERKYYSGDNNRGQAGETRKIQQIRVQGDVRNSNYNRKHNNRINNGPYNRRLERDVGQGQYTYNSQQLPTSENPILPDTRYPPPNFGVNNTNDTNGAGVGSNLNQRTTF